MTTEIKPIVQKKKKRGFVMTGGGAKGLYEAGVIHAFHVSGMEFDVVTGSSIGAMNSVFYAEYLYKKHGMMAEGVTDPQALIDALNPLIQAYQHAWLLMPTQKIVDDSGEGPLGQLKNDLAHYSLSLPWIIQSLWWWTDPAKKLPPPQPILIGLSKLVNEIIPRLGGEVLLNSIKNHRPLSVNEILRTYLSRFRMERSLVPIENEQLKNLFITEVSPLQESHLTGDVRDAAVNPGAGCVLVEPTRTLKDFAERQIAVRLTRSNYRTGRLEISQAVSVEDFVRFLQKYMWLKDTSGPDKIPLGSFRLQVPGNPNAVDAGLCSGRFPGVFAPFPVEKIYPKADPDNALLYQMLQQWINDPSVQNQLHEAYQKINPGMPPDDLERNFQKLIEAWCDLGLIGSYFPRAGDVYVDGGTIDNTPSNSAVDYVREWIDKNGASRRDYTLELFVIYLSTEPKIQMDQGRDPAIFDVVNRTLAIQGTASRTADANTVDVINTFGNRAEAVAQTLKVVLQNYQQTLAGMSEAERQTALANLSASTQTAGLENLDGLGTYLGGEADGLLGRIEHWDDAMIRHKLPLQVETVKIFPEEMPMDTLQFTKRLGYKKENAIKMLTMGCYDTLWALRKHLEETPPTAMDDQDNQVLGMIRKWMGGIETWPQDAKAQESLRTTWRCQRGDDCVFYKHHCPHGASQG